MVDVAAWLTGHFKAKNFKSKNKCVKVNIFEVGKAKHVADDSPSHTMEQICVPKHISFRELF